VQLLDELAHFIGQQRAHGDMIDDTGEPTDRGYMLTVRCPCGIVFYRWVTVDDAAREMVWSAMLATPS
jgi:hypothetical protein